MNVIAAPSQWQIMTRREERSEVLISPEGAGQWLHQAPLPNAPILVVADQSVAEYAQSLANAMVRADRQVGLITLELSEARKSLPTVATVYEEMVRRHLTRDSLVVAVGGGVLTDLAGYAASTYLRGIGWIAVPTTLLGQVDAAIGGKVAVNLETGKNLVGAFCLPRAVLLDAAPLATLPVDEWKVGLGEVVKSALIAGGWLWQRLSQPLPVVGQVSADWLDLIAHTAAIKVDIVNRDPWEERERMYLNFGHTLAHVLEQLSGYRQLRHGEAVGLGTLAALYLSEAQLGLDRRIRQQVLEWLRAWELPVSVEGLTYEAVEPVLLRDKKARGFGLQWILLKGVGVPEIVANIEPAQIREALSTISGHGNG